MHSSAASSVTTSPPPYRYFGAYRLFLALLVFTQHALEPIAPAWLAAALTPFEVGTVAVLMFFTLSGFIVTEAAVEFYGGRPGAFFLNRMLRIYPSYLVALAITIVIAFAMDFAGLHDILRKHVISDPKFSPTEIIANALAILPGGKTILNSAGAMPLIDVAWALRVELMFYFVMFLTLLGAQWSATAAKYWLAAAGLLALLAWTATHEPGQAGLYEFAPFFVAGAALYVVQRSRTREGRVVALLLAIAGSLASFAYVFDRPVVTIAGIYDRSLVGQLILFAVLFAIWLVLAFRIDHGERPGLVAADRFLGELTYPLYLLHTMASLIVDALVPAPGTGAYLLALAASLASAVIATATYEAGIGRLRARVRGFSLTGPSLAARVLPAAAPSPIDP